MKKIGEDVGIKGWAKKFRKITVYLLFLSLVLGSFLMDFSLPVIKIKKAHAAATDFVSTWNTANTSAGSSTASQINLPLVNGGTYNFTVDWGDTSSSTVTAWDDVDKLHTYAAPGTYTLTISGTITGWRFYNTGDKLKITNISQWGTLNLGNANGYFFGTTNLKITATDILDLTGTTNMTVAFRASGIDTVPSMNSWNVSSVTDMSYMFNDATSFNQPLNNWDVSSVDGMWDMFYGATSFNQPLANWNVSNVTDMSSMFRSATSFNQPLNSWNVSNVTYMSKMFQDASSFNQPLDNWNVSKVENASYMFYGATAFNSSLANWVLNPNVLLEYMFYGASSFNQPLNNWNVSSVTSMESMFYGATAFNSSLANWNVSSVTTMQNMFYEATSFNQPLNNWNVSSVTVMWNMFRDAVAFNQPLNNWNVSGVTDMDHMFYGATAFNQPLNSWDVSNVGWMDEMFIGTALSDANYSNILTSWSALPVQDGVWFGTDAQYYMGAPVTARAALIADHTWTITDGGLAGAWPPASITATSLGASSIQLDWVSGGGEAKFNLYRDGESGVGTLVYSGVALTFTDTGLISGTDYTYYLYSVDAGDVENADFAQVQGSTQTVLTYEPDIVFNPIPTDTKAINIDENQTIATNPYTIRVNPKGKYPIKKVDFYVDGILICTDSEPEENGVYSCDWDTSKYHSAVKVIVYDIKDHAAALTRETTVDLPIQTATFIGVPALTVLPQTGAALY